MASEMRTTYTAKDAATIVARQDRIPRWLILRHRFDEADGIVTQMENRAETIQELPPVTEVNEGAAIETREEKHVGYREIFTNPLYLRRTPILLPVWLFSIA